MEHPTLYIIQGFLGAGKSTFSKALAGKEKALRLNADEWCKDNYSPERLVADWDGCFANAVDNLWKVAKDLLQNNRSVIFDMGFWDVQSRTRAKQLALETQAQLVHYYIYAPDHILIERLRKRTGPIAENNLKNFALLKKAFQEPVAHEGAIRIDNY